MGIRDVLLLVFAAAWLAVILLTAWRTGYVPAELWAVLGVGTGGLIAVFRADSRGRRRTSGTPHDADETEDDDV
jgi:hypothetical protein